MATPVIQTQHLTKTYGKMRGVEQLDLEVMPGEVFGYLGPNGAGKTTTIRMLLGFIRPSSGSASVLGTSIAQRSVDLNRRIGYLPGELAMYDRLTAREMLRYFASLRGMDWRAALPYAERLGLDLKRRIRTLSKGNKQKVGLVQAFMHEPELLVLDEPTSGLDPLVQQEFNRMIDEVKAQGRTVFLSSHVLAEVELLADRVGIIREGRLVDIDTISELKTRAVRRLRLEFGAPVPKTAFDHVPNLQNLQLDTTVLECEVAGSVDALIKTAAQFEVVNISSATPDLEAIFLQFYKGGSDVT